MSKGHKMESRVEPTRDRAGMTESTGRYHEGGAMVSRWRFEKGGCGQ